ncbi:alpha/beta fold hydrolase [Rhodococcus sp. NPDC127528]|uniref:alpha/beta fold hydrolase n=1 Tax=unclassified Rhodococcus (in: high G+C Gram-positive bacteria) TaxID=192944 RepID=UPI003638BB68
MQVNESELHVVVDGDGPPVLLCGGLAGNWFDWDAVTRALEPDHTVIRFDRPGFGLSAPTGRPPTARGEAARISAVLDAVGVVDPVLVVGHSMGGWYAEAFARLYRDRAAGLVLLDASVEPPRQPALPSPWRYGLASATAAVVSGIGLQRLCGPTVHRLAHQAEPDAAIAPLMERIVTRPSYLRAVLIENAAYADLPAEMVPIRGEGPLPDTLVVAADPGLPWSGAWLRTQRGLAADLGARFEVLRPARHTAMIDRPAAVAALIAGMTG